MAARRARLGQIITSIDSSPLMFMSGLVDYSVPGSSSGEGSSGSSSSHGFGVSGTSEPSSPSSPSAVSSSLLLEGLYNEQDMLVVDHHNLNPLIPGLMDDTELRSTMAFDSSAAAGDEDLEPETVTVAQSADTDGEADDEDEVEVEVDSPRDGVSDREHEPRVWKEISIICTGVWRVCPCIARRIRPVGQGGSEVAGDPHRGALHPHQQP